MQVNTAFLNTKIKYWTLLMGLKVQRTKNSLIMINIISIIKAIIINKMSKAVLIIISFSIVSKNCLIIIKKISL